MKTKAYHVIALVVSAVLLSGMGASAAEIEGVVFQDSITVDGKELPVRGTGLFRYLGFIKAYVGALYMPDDISPERVLADIPKRLEIEYFHAIKGEDFGAATNKILSQNLDAATLERLMPRVELHNNLYRDVKPGDRYTLTYMPGRGTELALNGEPLGMIEGKDFASAIYAMWLGDKPMNKSFKRQLMGV
ncbi:MAG: chalcone isomerase family protein [Deltaproteobacteria bacterium]|nr:chalcone isomerase family protein [Deltaproteobacteria bacterium]